jgi:TetR/AcrR family transcriptional regulator, transcriptional repressor for nem operon
MARPRQFDEEKILAAVRDEFWKNGYTATSLDDLMRATGLGKGSIYAAFGDKRQLFLTALKVYADATLTNVRVALSSDRPAIERLRMLFERSDCAPRGNGCYRGCFLANSTTELASIDKDVTALARGIYHAVEELVVEVVREAQGDGALSREIRAEDLGRLMLAIMQGEEFLQKSGMPLSDLRSIGRAVEKLLFSGVTGKRRRSHAARR